MRPNLSTSRPAPASQSSSEVHPGLISPASPQVEAVTLSFVIPAYNEERYLADCIRSIQEQIDAQAGPLGIQAEIIVVNNASTDSTGELARSFPGVRVVDETRKGLPYARQAGFDAARGTFVANVDADSRLSPNWITKSIQAFRAEPKLIALSGPLVYYDLTPRQQVGVRIFYATAWLTYALNRYILRAGSMIQGGNVVVRRDAIAQINGYDTSITFYGEDTDLARRLRRLGPVRFTFAFPMLSSARRLKHEGMLTMAARYSINYLWTTYLQRPFTHEHLDVREQPEG
jgi:glycosyltransferase involved in cell wall biosynthesis